jgi:hypothetical protein
VSNCRISRARPADIARILEAVAQIGILSIPTLLDRVMKFTRGDLDVLSLGGETSTTSSGLIARRCEECRIRISFFMLRRRSIFYRQAVHVLYRRRTDPPE